MKKDIIVLGLALPLLLSSACQRSKEKSEKRRARKTKVVVDVVQRKTVSESIRALGTIEAKERIDISAEIEGPIEGINFEEGSMVEKGELLFCIDQKVLTARVERARPTVELARQNLERTKSLFQSNTASRQELDDAQHEFDMAQADLELRIRELSKACVKAPFAGRIGRRLVSPGQFVLRGEKLAALIDVEHLEAVLSISEADMARVELGQRVKLKVKAYGDEVFEGKISLLSPELDQSTRSLLIKAKLENEEGKLRPGMFCRAEILCSDDREVLLLPDSALIIRGKKKEVFIVDKEGRAQKQMVSTGAHFDGSVEISKGLEQGSKVIVEGWQKLRDGANVDAAPSPRVPPMKGGSEK